MLGAIWGVGPDETRLTFACDDFVRAPALKAWRGVSIAAPPAEVWTWVTQVRVAPYSYDWIDNGRRPSPRERLGLPAPVVGESFTASAGKPLGRIVQVDHGRSLTGHILGAYMTYLLAQHAEGTTRLLLKVVMETNLVVAQALCLGDLLMARKQLLTIKSLAELEHGAR